jgi:hypothetical protein
MPGKAFEILDANYPIIITPFYGRVVAGAGG